MSATNKSGRILLFTGDGKGKTTAALGLVLRSVGHGYRCLVIQFIKGNSSTGELTGISHLPGVTLVQSGLGFVPPPTDPAFKQHRTKAREGLKLAAQALSGGVFDLVVLDEVCVAVSKECLEEQSLIDAVKGANHTTTIVLTGRGASDALIAIADTATEMCSIRHALQQGRAAQQGVEW